MPDTLPPASTAPARSQAPAVDPSTLRHAPARVPSQTHPGRWVYLEGWKVSRDPDFASRSHGSTCCVLSVIPGAWVIQHCDGLRQVYGATRGDLAATIDAADRHLLSIGAEPVPEAEWAIYRSGGIPRPDRVPLSLADLDFTKGITP